MFEAHTFWVVKVIAEEEMQKHLLARYRHGSVSVVFDVVPQEVLDETFKNKVGVGAGRGGVCGAEGEWRGGFSGMGFGATVGCEIRFAPPTKP